MTRPIIVTTLISILLFSCKTSTVKTNGQTSANTDSLKIARSDKLRQDSMDCAGIMAKSIENRGLFSATYLPDTMGGISKRLHKTIPFDTLIVKTKDTLFYSFKVSSPCCVKYSGMFFFDEDTFILMYGYCGEACGGDCDYTLSYKIPTKKYKYKRIEIGFLDLKKLRDKSGHRS